MRWQFYILPALIIPLGELHKFFIDPNWNVDVFLYKEYILNFQWVVKDIGQMLQFSIVAYLAYKLSYYGYGIPKIVTHILKAIYIYSWLDLGLYFVNFKTGFYGIIYYVIAFFLIFIKYFPKSIHHSHGKAN